MPVRLYAYRGINISSSFKDAQSDGVAPEAQILVAGDSKREMIRSGDSNLSEQADLIPWS